MPDYERKRIIQALEYYNGCWMYAYDVVQAADIPFRLTYTKQVLRELVEKGEVELEIGPQGGTKYRKWDPDRPIRLWTRSEREEEKPPTDVDWDFDPDRR